MPCTCQILTVFKSGWARKSPPIEKLIKGYAFKLRLCTLGINELCSQCSRNNNSCGTKKLVFSYFEDQDEKKLKGRFEVEKSTLERVYSITEDPEKYSNEKYILKWTMRKYNRTLYLLLNGEDELNRWLNSFGNYKRIRESGGGGGNGGVCVVENEDSSENRRSGASFGSITSNSSAGSKSSNGST